jgi:hypothetical protein
VNNLWKELKEKIKPKTLENLGLDSLFGKEEQMFSEKEDSIIEIPETQSKSSSLRRRISSASTN